MTQAFEEQLSLLTELQEIDLTLHNLQASLDRLPLSLEEIKTSYLATKSLFEITKTELDEVEKTKRTDEIELAASVDHLRTREAKLYAIKTNKEYQAALKEVSDGKRLNKDREDRILQAMEKIEILTQKTTQLNQEFADKEIAYKTKAEELKTEETNIREKMKDGIARRPVVASKIDKDVIRKYEFVRQRYAQAVASVTDGICQGCSTRIPPQLFNEMLRRDIFKACPSCQRLLYVPETPAEGSENK